jgi:hypothetical protein
LKQLEIAKSLRGRSPFNGLPWFSWLVIAVIIAGIAPLACSQLPSSNSNAGQPKAAIIDQLYSTQPNDDFIAQVSKDLKAYGFIVDIYQGGEVTVDFYRKLPECGYKLIIFRAHSGLIKSKEQGIVKTAIFTAEPYSRTKYLSEQVNHMLPMVRVRRNEPFFFGIDSKFVMDCMEGRFDDTVIIISGCSCLYFDDMAQAFIYKGASVYLAWNRTVNADYADEASAYLIEELCKDVTIRKAISRTIIEKGRDPTYRATLKYFPSDNGDKTLKQLIQQ